MSVPAATRAPELVTSSDGVTIAYDRYDAGPGSPLVICVGGATTTRVLETGFGEALAAAGLTGVAYDRRGRGDSTDAPAGSAYAVQLEVDDVAAIVEAVRPGGTAVLVGFSSGAALCLQAAAAGAPVSHVVAFEPPYRVEGSPVLPERYASSLEELIAEGRPDAAYEFFMTQAVGMPQEMVDGMKGSPFWDHFVGVAHTLSYDAHCLGGDNGHPVPTSLVASVGVPVLALASTGSPDWLRTPARLVAEAAADGRHDDVEGEFHTAPDEVLVTAIRAFVA